MPSPGILDDRNDHGDEEGLAHQQDAVDRAGVAQGDGRDPQGRAEDVDEEDHFPLVPEQFIETVVQMVLPHVVDPFAKGADLPRHDALHGDVGPDRCGWKPDHGR
jgi:hypothetical protein